MIPHPRALGMPSPSLATPTPTLAPTASLPQPCARRQTTTAAHCPTFQRGRVTQREASSQPDTWQHQLRCGPAPALPEASLRCSRGPAPCAALRGSTDAAVVQDTSTLDLPLAGMEQVDVDLGDRSYPIYIGPGILDQGDLLARHIKGKQVLIVTNETVAPLYLDRTVAALRKAARPDLVVETVVLPDGEEYKDLATLNLIFDKAIATRMDRRCTLLALGGGVVGDMTGFAAATYLRGVDFIQIPTTVMSQVDSSVGGKTGVNHALGKNLIGAFYQPQCVLIDTLSLGTLPDRELASGFAEVVKYGLIRDAPFFEWQEANMEKLMARDPEALAYAIKRSCENKAAVVAADEKESGLRATLNLGHTFGHAIENGLGYGEWLHGEAVAAGTVMAADMSQRLGWIDAPLVERIRSILQRANLPIEPPPQVSIDQFRSLMAVDKKVADGKLRLILLKGPLGGCVFTGDFDPAALEATLQHFCKR